MRKRYTIDDIINAVKESTTLTDVVRKLGLSVAGGNMETISRKIRQHSIDTSHFNGKNFNKGKEACNKKPIEFYLTENIVVKSDYLKKRLIKENVFEHKCMLCGLSKWQGRQIPLELHHSNGDRTNNTLENIMIICPNCHKLEHEN